MKDGLKEIEIPLGAKDSELCGWEYTIPEGMEATIVDNKIVVKKKESEDESIINEITKLVMQPTWKTEKEFQRRKELCAWLEKQGEHKKFRDGIQVGDKVTRNRDGMLVNLSQLNRVAKKDEQKPTDKVEPKFKVGDLVVVNDSRIGRIIDYTKNFAYVDLGFSYLSTRVNNIRLWTVQDAKDGDVLCSGQIILLFKKWEDTDWNFVIAYAGIDISGELQITNGHWLISNYAHPATKEQRDTLFAKIKEAGYEWDADKKELKKIENKNKKND